MLRSIGLPEMCVIAVVIIATIVPFWKIFDKLGFNRWLSLLMVVPLANVIVSYYVAFARAKTR
jgi:hypothetical protein